MFIGEKTIKETKNTGEKTAGGIDIIEVEFEDGTKEIFSNLLHEKIISEESCDATKLRDKRIYPVVEAILALLRDWGIKLSELPYLSAVLNQSLQENEKEALKTLWKEWIPTINSIDDVDLITVDRILKTKKKTLEDILDGK